MQYLKIRAEMSFIKLICYCSPPYFAVRFIISTSIPCSHSRLMYFALLPYAGLPHGILAVFVKGTNYLRLLPCVVTRELVPEFPLFSKQKRYVLSPQVFLDEQVMIAHSLNGIEVQ